jgi:hypothetical protein
MKYITIFINLFVAGALVYLYRDLLIFWDHNKKIMTLPTLITYYMLTSSIILLFVMIIYSLTKNKNNEDIS